MKNFYIEKADNHPERLELICTFHFQYCYIPFYNIPTMYLNIKDFIFEKAFSMCEFRKSFILKD